MAKHVVLYVDCSGSMDGIVAETHAACLTLLTKMQSINEDIYISYFGFDDKLYFGFTRKKAKYLSSIPSPFDHGGTQIYRCFNDSFSKLDIQPSDEMIFVIATDGGDGGYDENQVERARQNYIKYKNTNKAQMFLVSLAGSDRDIKEVGRTLGVPIGNIAWGKNIEQTLTQFARQTFSA